MKDNGVRVAGYIDKGQACDACKQAKKFGV